MNDLDEDLIESPYDFSVILNVRHPNLTVEDISNLVGFEPTFSNNVGTERTAPNGAKVGGLNRESRWIMSRTGNDTRFFFQEIQKILEYLEDRKETVLSISETGGEIEFYFQLDGQKNIGDTLTWSVMKKLAALQISVGVEVFP